ncbi:hypothetical protein MP638_004186, partial [Amoeboaphelidium occidentale]
EYVTETKMAKMKTEIDNLRLQREILKKRVAELEALVEEKGKMNYCMMSTIEALQVKPSVGHYVGGESKLLLQSHENDSGFSNKNTPPPPPPKKPPVYALMFIMIENLAELSFEEVKDDLKSCSGKSGKWCGCNFTRNKIIMIIPTQDLDGPCVRFLKSNGYHLEELQFDFLVDDRDLLVKLCAEAVKTNKKEAEAYLIATSDSVFENYDLVRETDEYLAKEKEHHLKREAFDKERKARAGQSGHSLSRYNDGKGKKRALDSGKETSLNKRYRYYFSLCAPTMFASGKSIEYVRVFYSNIQGGLSYKARPLLDMFGNDFDVFVLVETWFDEANKESYRPWLVSHSPMRPQDRAGVRAGRAHSGIVVLARPELKQSVSKIKQCPYSVAVKFNNFVLLALYLPPTTLSTAGVREVLQGYNEMFPDIVVGDFNCHPLEDGSERSCVVIETLSIKWGLQYSQPNGGVLKHDHAFVRSKLKSESCLIHPLPIRTDHPKGIGILSSFCLDKCNNIGKEIVRFNLHRLQDGKFVNLLQSVYASQIRTNWLSDFKQIVRNDNFREFIESQYDYL